MTSRQSDGWVKGRRRKHVPKVGKPKRIALRCEVLRCLQQPSFFLQLLHGLVSRLLLIGDRA